MNRALFRSITLAFAIGVQVAPVSAQAPGLPSGGCTQPVTNPDDVCVPARSTCDPRPSAPPVPNPAEPASRFTTGTITLSAGASPPGGILQTSWHAEPPPALLPEGSGSRKLELPASGGPSVLPAPSEAPPQLAPPRLFIDDLQDHKNQLHTQREQLKSDLEAKPLVSDGASDEYSKQLSLLRRRASELMLKVIAQQKAHGSPAAKPPPSASTSGTTAGPAPREILKPQPMPSRSSGHDDKKGDAGESSHAPDRETSPDAPQIVDPIALGQTLFRAGDYQGALNAFGALDPKQQKRDQQIMLQYSKASCLRKLGRTDDAAALYREIANSKGDPFLSECAQWQLEAIRWRLDLESELEQLRKRRQSGQEKP